MAGSVGSGLADRFSDLELDCYWFLSAFREELSKRRRAIDPPGPGS